MSFTKEYSSYLTKKPQEQLSDHGCASLKDMVVAVECVFAGNAANWCVSSPGKDCIGRQSRMKQLSSAAMLSLDLMVVFCIGVRVEGVVMK